MPECEHACVCVGPPTHVCPRAFAACMRVVGSRIAVGLRPCASNGREQSRPPARKHARTVGRHQRRAGQGWSGRRRYQLRVRLVFQRCLMHIQQRTAASRENESLHEQVAKLWQDNQFLTARPPPSLRRPARCRLPTTAPLRGLLACCVPRGHRAACRGRGTSGDVPCDAHRLPAGTDGAGRFRCGTRGSRTITHGSSGCGTFAPGHLRNEG